MNAMSRDLAREVGRERAAGARHRRLVKEAKGVRRARRRAQREATGSWWSRRNGVPVGAQPVLTAAPAPRPEDVTRALGDLLNGIAEQIAEEGTVTERAALHALHDAARWSAPGAAAALVDWDGPETVRLRAFGVLHGVVLGVLGQEDRAWLLDRLGGESSHERSDQVA